MFTTLKGQILLVSTALVLLLATQFFLSRNSQSTFVESLDLTQQALVKVNLVRELERDVIDLQRNVLIYKESASDSAITRFNDLMQKNYANLAQLKLLTSQQENSDRFLSYISRMNNHLNDYQESFSNVIVGRMRRESLYEIGLAVDFETLFESIKIEQNQSHSEQESIEKAKYHIARAESILLKFSHLPEQQLIEPFQLQIKLAKQQIKQQLSL